MFYKIISLILIISSFGITFFPFQSSLLRILGFLILLFYGGIKKNELKIIISITIILSIYYLNCFQVGIITFYVTLIFSVLFFKYLKNKKFIYEFIKVTYFFAKLILLVSFISIVINNFQTITVNSSTYNSIGPLLYTYLPTSVLGFDYYRPVLLFYEPGAIQIIFAISLYFEAIKGRFLKKKYLIFSLALICLMSSTGLISLLFLTLFFGVKQFNLNLKGVILILSLFSFYPLFISNFNDKLDGQNSQSSLARFADFYNGYYLFEKKPFFGHGILTNEDYSNLIPDKFYLEFFIKDSKTQNSLKYRGNSVGIVNILYSFGMFGLFIFLIFYLFLIKQNNALKFLTLIFLSSQPLIFTPFIIVFLYSQTIKI